MDTRMLSLQSTVTPKSTDTQIPCLGFGVYQIPGDQCETACQHAIEAGYRLIDTAQIYRNEEKVGAAIQNSRSNHSDIFVVTKQGVRGETPEATYDLAAQSVSKIRGGRQAYVDLFLVHVPYIRGDIEGRKEVWQALERLHKEGKARLIGVSNFGIDHIEEMKSYATLWPPHVNQIELHPWCQQQELVAYCHQHGIVVQAYSPLAEGNQMEDPVLQEVARKYCKSPAQVLLRYGLQKGWVVLPKSANKARIEENADVFGFCLTDQDMSTLDQLEQDARG